MRLTKKSQAALEFLTTYGWAFLIILIMIGTLAYFGILNPGNILPNRCTFGSEFQCLDYQISTSGAGTFKIRLKNGAGEIIDVSSITLSSEGTTQVNCGTPSPSPGPTAWKQGEIREISWSGCNYAAAGLSAGAKGKISITITYNSVLSGSGYSKQVKGEVYAAVL